MKVKVYKINCKVNCEFEGKQTSCNRKVENTINFVTFLANIINYNLTTLRKTQKENEVTEYNSVPIDENNLFFQWHDHPLNWWPTLEEFSACYIMVCYNIWIVKNLRVHPNSKLKWKLLFESRFLDKIVIILIPICS